MTIVMIAPVNMTIVIKNMFESSGAR